MYTKDQDRDGRGWSLSCHYSVVPSYVCRSTKHQLRSNRPDQNTTANALGRYSDNIAPRTRHNQISRGKGEEGNSTDMPNKQEAQIQQTRPASAWDGKTINSHQKEKQPVFNIERRKPGGSAKLFGKGKLASLVLCILFRFVLVVPSFFISALLSFYSHSSSTL